MKNKKVFAFLSLALAGLLVFSACTFIKKDSGKTSSSENQTSESSNSDSSHSSSDSNSSSESSSDSSSDSSSSSESEPPVVTHTVTFVVDGTVVQTSTVNHGELAQYTGSTPTKMPDANALRYRFKGWDKDTTLPIVEDTEFNAVFAAYVAEQILDDFEQYDDSATMIDEGWKALGYSNSTGQWTTETKAAVSIGTNSMEGKRALRFDAWENGVGYKFVKTLKGNEFPKAANAIQFRLMTPSINALTVLLNANVKIGGTDQSPVFKYRLTPSSSEYVEYTIPFDDDNWILWDQPVSIKAAAEWTGIHQDDLVNYLTGIEFYLQGDDGGHGWPYAAFLDSVKFVTLDNPSLNQDERMYQFNRYTATLNSENILRVDIQNNGDAVAKVIDLEVPQEIPGKITVVDKDITFTSNDNGQSLVYGGKLMNGGQKIKFVSASGTFKNAVDDVDLTAVQVVDDYEQYETDGQAYCQDNLDPDQRSGARGAYYSEVYTGSGSSDWGGNGWSLLDGDGSQLKLVQDQAGAHSGNNYLSLKHMKNNAVRYMQWGLFDGTAEKNSFRGSKLGFWAKTDGAVKSVTFYAYSQSSPTNATKDNYVKKATFNISSATMSEWKHFELELNPQVVYYGFMLLVEKDYVADSTLFIDDVEIYSADPYAHYVEPEPEPEPDYNLVPGVTYYGKFNGLVKAQLDVVSSSSVALFVPGFDIDVNGTYTVNEREITFTFSGTTYVATSSENKDKLTYKSVSGSDDIATILNNLSFDLVKYGDNAETYEDSGTMYYQSNMDENSRSGARGAYYCDYYSGNGSSPLGGSGWQLMGGNGDQLSLDKTTAAEGSQSIRIKGNASLDMRYFDWHLYDGTATAKTGATKMIIWLKNSESIDVSIRIMAYSVQQVTAANQTTGRDMMEVTVPANTDWTEYTLELDPTKTYYGHALMMKKNGGASTYYLNFDYVHFVSEDDNPDVNYFAKKDLVLSGAVVSGAASVKFDGGGKAYFTCEGLGMNNVEGTYVMSMNGVMQEVTFDFNGTIVKATYGVDFGGSVTMIITEASGAGAAYFTIGAEFNNN